MNTLTVLVGLSAGQGHGLGSAKSVTAVETAVGTTCASHPLLLTSYPIILTTEDLDEQIETAASEEKRKNARDLALAMVQRKDLANSAGRQKMSAQDAQAIRNAGLARYSQQMAQHHANLAAADAAAAAFAMIEQGFVNELDSAPNEPLEQPPAVPKPAGDEEEADVGCDVHDAQGDRITDAAWNEELDDPETARLVAVLLARNRAS